MDCFRHCRITVPACCIVEYLSDHYAIEVRMCRLLHTILHHLSGHRLSKCAFGCKILISKSVSCSWEWLLCCDKTLIKLSQSSETLILTEILHKYPESMRKDNHKDHSSASGYGIILIEKEHYAQNTVSHWFESHPEQPFFLFLLEQLSWRSI